MSDDGAEPQREVSTTIPGHVEDGRQQELLPPADLLQRVLEVERQRIDSTNRRTDVVLQAVKASDESDRRQFEFQLEKLRSDERMRTRRDNLAKVVVLGGGAFSLCVGVLFLYMAFFGAPEQSATALNLIEKIAIGGGGYGIIAGIITGVRRLLRAPQ
jgi:hypothetical protein